MTLSGTGGIGASAAVTGPEHKTRSRVKHNPVRTEVFMAAKVRGTAAGLDYAPVHGPLSRRVFE